MLGAELRGVHNMKTIGLIGGMSWESTVVYYQLLNRGARTRLGKLHSADLLLRSFNFADIERCQASGDWHALTLLMQEAARQLEQAGAQCIVICTNTMHKMSAEVQEAVSIPLIHIADATAPAIKVKQVEHPLLLATGYTMEQEFYKGYLLDNHGVRVRVPNDEDRATVHDIIYKELCVGVVSPQSKQAYLDVIGRNDTDGVILGCTEVGLLLSQADTKLPVFDTTALHVEAALDFSLQ